MKGQNGVASAWFFLSSGSQPCLGCVCVCVCGLCLGGYVEKFDNSLGDMETKSMSLGESSICLFLDSRLFSFRKLADFLKIISWEQVLYI